MTYAKISFSCRSYLKLVCYSIDFGVILMDELKVYSKNKFDVVSVSELSKYEYSFYKPILGNLLNGFKI